MPLAIRTQAERLAAAAAVPVVLAAGLAADRAAIDEEAPGDRGFSLCMIPLERKMATENETSVSQHETLATDRTPSAAKALSIWLLIWVFVSGLAVLGAFTFLRGGG
jgi:hypothetical protein